MTPRVPVRVKDRRLTQRAGGRVSETPAGGAGRTGDAGRGPHLGRQFQLHEDGARRDVGAQLCRPPVFPGRGDSPRGAEMARGVDRAAPGGVVDPRLDGSAQQHAVPGLLHVRADPYVGGQRLTHHRHDPIAGVASRRGDRYRGAAAAGGDRWCAGLRRRSTHSGGEGSRARRRAARGGYRHLRGDALLGGLHPGGQGDADPDLDPAPDRLDYGDRRAGAPPIGRAGVDRARLEELESPGLERCLVRDAPRDRRRLPPVEQRGSRRRERPDRHLQFGDSPDRHAGRLAAARGASPFHPDWRRRLDRQWSPSLSPGWISASAHPPDADPRPRFPLPRLPCPQSSPSIQAPPEPRPSSSTRTAPSWAAVTGSSRSTFRDRAGSSTIPRTSGGARWRPDARQLGSRASAPSGLASPISGRRSSSGIGRRSSRSGAPSSGRTAAPHRAAPNFGPSGSRRCSRNAPDWSPIPISLRRSWSRCWPTRPSGGGRNTGNWRREQWTAGWWLGSPAGRVTSPITPTRHGRCSTGSSRRAGTPSCSPSSRSPRLFSRPSSVQVR